MQSKKRKERTLQEPSESIRKNNVRIVSIAEGEEREQFSLFKHNETFPNLRKDPDSRIQETNRIPNYLNPKKAFSKAYYLKTVKN